MIKISCKSDRDLAHTESMNNSDAFWGQIAKQFEWKKPWQSVQSGKMGDQSLAWFEGGKLNITENALDRHVKKNPDKIALIYEPNSPSENSKVYTYHELLIEVCKASNMFKNMGIKKGDTVCFYMPQIPELLIGVLACARIGAIHSVVFAGFSAEALASRIQNCQATLLVTANEGLRGSKKIPLKTICDEALQKCPSIKNTLVFERTKSLTSMQAGRDHWWHDSIKETHTACNPEIMDAEDALFILYTSGSTGSPKGLLHTCGGYMVYAGYSFDQVFRARASDDIFWCTADIGWITGHTYLCYGPLLNGSTVLMFEGVPNFPDAGRFWEVIEKHRVTHFYTAPTAIRSLMMESLDFVKRHNLDSLKVIGSVGEPINQEAWDWYNTHVGKNRCPLVDTWWQTETGGIMISALAGITEPLACFATYPLPGINPILVNEAGQEIPFKPGEDSEGYLCIKSPWPSIARTILGDHDRYKKTYFSVFPGYYFTGDGARRDASGRFRITGRVDDVLNVSGHRIGTAEIENAINEHPRVIESAVVGSPHEIKGQGICAFVICNTYPREFTDPKNMKAEIVATVSKLIGPIAKPDTIVFVDGLPKTRSGKIMRRILRKLTENTNSDLGDTSTLLDPNVVEKIKTALASLSKP